MTERVIDKLETTRCLFQRNKRLMYSVRQKKSPVAAVLKSKVMHGLQRYRQAYLEAAVPRSSAELSAHSNACNREGQRLAQLCRGGLNCIRSFQIKFHPSTCADDGRGINILHTWAQKIMLNLTQTHPPTS